MSCAKLVVLVALCAPWQARPLTAAPSFSTTIASVQPKVVKIYGAGGFRGLEAYQSGILISAEGHVLTVWSYVLDTETITVTLNDGRRYDAVLVGADPRLELAVLKIEANDLPYFDLSAAATAAVGERVLAFANLFGVATGNEPVSVLHGTISVRTRLEARRGVFETPYRGPVYVLDAITNNAGGAGGGLTNLQGELVAMLGKELRNSLNNTWLNYAIPIEEVIETVDKIIAGEFTNPSLDDPAAKPEHGLTAELLGIVMIADVVERTPPFVDAVRRGSPAEEAGLRPDDLVLFVNDHLTQSCKAVESELEFVDRADTVKITVIREQELIDVVLQAPATAASGEAIR